MPAMKCPACGHRHFQVVSACLNCGEPLGEQPVAFNPYENETVEQAPPPPTASRRGGQGAPPRRIAARSSRTEADIAEYERRLAERGRSETVQSGGPSSENNGRQLQPYAQQMPSTEVEQSGRWRKQTAAVQPYTPYQTAIEVSSPDPFQSSSRNHGDPDRPPTRIRIEEEQEQRRVEDPLYWKTERFPIGFPRTKPGLAGSVLHMESKEEILDHPNIFAAIATLLVELIWVITNVQQDRDSDRIMMTTLRIQRYDGSLKDARLRGNLRGANLSLGDEVSLWGWQQNGTLNINRGYNHTTKGVISTHSIGLILPAILVILAFIVGVYFLPSWSPIAGQLLGHLVTQFFPFAKNFHLTLPMQKK